MTGISHRNNTVDAEGLAAVHNEGGIDVMQRETIRGIEQPRVELGFGAGRARHVVPLKQRLVHQLQAGLACVKIQPGSLQARGRDIDGDQV